jgi:hypothetical protein
MDRQYCHQLACVKCRNDADCDDPAAICDPDKLDCVGCLLDDDCEDGAVCDKKMCKP